MKTNENEQMNERTNERTNERNQRTNANAPRELHHLRRDLQRRQDARRDGAVEPCRLPRDAVARQLERGAAQRGVRAEEVRELVSIGSRARPSLFVFRRDARRS